MITTQQIRYENLIHFQQISQTLTHREEDAHYIDDIILNRPKFRRAIGPALQDTFLNLVSLLQVSSFFEIGVMNGRHTKIILANDEKCAVYSFEPNIYCFPSLIPLLENDRLTLVPFAVSSQSGFADFYFPLKVNGKDLKPMSGVSSLNRLNDKDAVENELKSQMVATISGKDYLEAHPDINPSSLALWIDTEGHAKDVLGGFGDHLSHIPIMIIEVEYGELFSSSPNWNDVIAILNQFDYCVVGRDFQTLGQCNILVVKSHLLDDVKIQEGLKSFNDLISLAKGI